MFDRSHTHRLDELDIFAFPATTTGLGPRASTSHNLATFYAYWDCRDCPNRTTARADLRAVGIFPTPQA